MESLRYARITLGLFVFTLVGHWIFAWFAYVGEQTAHHQPVAVGEYAVQMTRDTLENWQSEFLQLRRLDSQEGDRLIAELDDKYPRR